MTAPLRLMSYATADLPTASLWPGSLAYVSDTAKVAYSDGTVWVSLRERLAADRTYYVRTDGSDTNTGLVDSAGGAFLTWQKAIDTVTDNLDFGGYTVSIVHGTETGTKTFTGSILLNISGWAGGGLLIIDGISSANCVLSSSSFTIFTSGVFGPSPLIIRNFKLTSSGDSCCLHSALGSLNFTDGMNFGSAASWHMQSHNGGSPIYVNGTNVISGGALAHFFSSAGGVIFHEGTVSTTLTGTPAFGAAFAFATSGALIQSIAQTFVNAATGPRYRAELNAVINTSGSGVNYFPGNVAGTTATGGQYA